MCALAFWEKEKTDIFRFTYFFHLHYCLQLMWFILLFLFKKVCCFHVYFVINVNWWYLASCFPVIIIFHIVCEFSCKQQIQVLLLWFFVYVCSIDFSLCDLFYFFSNQKVSSVAAADKTKLKDSHMWICPSTSVTLVLCLLGFFDQLRADRPWLLCAGQVQCCEQVKFVSGSSLWCFGWGHVYILTHCYWDCALAYHLHKAWTHGT